MVKMNIVTRGIILLAVLISAISCNKTRSTSLRVVMELNIGESNNVELNNGDIVNISLIEINEIRDSLRDAIREAYVRITVDGEEITLSSGNYNLPLTVGKIQIDCRR